MKTSVSRRRMEQQHSTLFLQRVVLSATILCSVAGMATSVGTSGSATTDLVAGYFSATETWTLQLLAGLSLALIGIAGTIRSLQPKPRRRAQGGWTMVDVVLVGVVGVLLIGRVLSGLVSAWSDSGGIDVTHLASAVLLIALPVVFLVIEYAHGQIALILRVFRPGPLASGPRPPSIADLIHRYGASIVGFRRAKNSSSIATPAQRTALVAIAITTLLLVLTTVFALDRFRADVQTAGVHRLAQR